MAPYVNEQKIPWISTVALDSLTRSQASPYIFRFVPSTYQYALVAAQLTQKMGWKKLYYIGWNAPPGRESADVAKKLYGAENVIDAQFPNIGTADYAPYLTAMDAEKADGTLAAMWGSDAPACRRTIWRIWIEQQDAPVRHRSVYQRRAYSTAHAAFSGRGPERLHLLRNF